MKFLEWFETFLEEKQIGFQMFEFEIGEDIHVIDSDHVIELIKTAPAHEQAKIKSTLVKIDFADGDVMDFIKHMAWSRAMVISNS